VDDEHCRSRIFRRQVRTTGGADGSPTVDGMVATCRLVRA
jgi:hypothetical protein